MSATTDDPSAETLDDLGSELLPVSGGPITVTSTATGAVGRLTACCIGVCPGTAVTGSLTLMPSPTEERWTRRIGATPWSTTLSRPDPATIVERVGAVLALRFEVGLDDSGTTSMVLRSLHLGPIPIPLPDRWGVRSDVSPHAGTDVTIRVPGGSCSYHVEFGARR